MILETMNTQAAATCLHSGRELTTVLLQMPQDEGNGKLMVVFMGIAAISLLILALVVVGTLVALAVVGLKAKTALEKTLQEVKGRAYPLIEKSTSLVADLTPTIKSIAGKTDTLIGDLSPTIKGITEKTHLLVEELSPKISGITDDVHGITSHALAIAEMGKQKLQEFSPAIMAARETLMQANATVRSANEKTERQVERVNSMVTDVLDWTVQLPAKLEHTLRIPGRRIEEVTTRVRTEGASLLEKWQNLWRGFLTIRGGSTGSRGSTPNGREDAQETPAPHEDMVVTD